MCFGVCEVHAYLKDPCSRTRNQTAWMRVCCSYCPCLLSLFSSTSLLLSLSSSLAVVAVVAVIVVVAGVVAEVWHHATQTQYCYKIHAIQRILLVEFLGGDSGCRAKTMSLIFGVLVQMESCLLFGLICGQALVAGQHFDFQNLGAKLDGRLRLASGCLSL